jgi:hypothetical protein
MLPLTGERKPLPVVQSGFDETQGQFSRDGRWLAYASNEQDATRCTSVRFPNRVANGRSRWPVGFIHGGGQTVKSCST